MRVVFTVLLCALLACANALPARMSRRALREEQPRTVLGQPLVELTWQNTCPERGVNFRFHVRYDGDYDYFSKDFTDVVPAPFLDYMCDNIGQVGSQYAEPDNHLDDPAIQEALRNGTCLNEQVMLRWPGWQGHGPQKSLSIEWPNGTVYDVYIALNVEDGEQPAISIAEDGIEETVYRTADFGAECDEGQAGCMQWARVNLDSLAPTVTFECAKPAGSASKKGRN